MIDGQSVRLWGLRVTEIFVPNTVDFLGKLSRMALKTRSVPNIIALVIIVLIFIFG